MVEAFSTRAVLGDVVILPAGDKRVGVDDVQRTGQDEDGHVGHPCDDASRAGGTVISFGSPCGGGDAGRRIPCASENR